MWCTTSSVSGDHEEKNTKQKFLQCNLRRQSRWGELSGMRLATGAEIDMPRLTPATVMRRGAAQFRGRNPCVQLRSDAQNGEFPHPWVTSQYIHLAKRTTKLQRKRIMRRTKRTHTVAGIAARRTELFV